MSGGYAVLRGLGAALTAGLVATGALSAAPSLVRTTETAELGWPAASTQLVLRPGPGSVQIREGSVPGISVEQTWSFADPEPTVTTSGAGVTTVALNCSQGLVTRCQGDWEIVVPEGTDLVVDGAVGDIELEGVTGRVRVDAAAGDVHLSGSPVVVDASLDLGTISAVLSEAPAEVRARTNLGDIELIVPGGVAYDVRTRADAADVQVRVEHDPGSPHRIDMTANLGSIRIDRG